MSSGAIALTIFFSIFVGLPCLFVVIETKLFGLVDIIWGTDIHVTQEDIDESERGSQSSCAIARAVTRELKTKYPDNVKTDACVSNHGGFHIGLFYGWSKYTRGKRKGREKYGEYNQIWRDVHVHPDMDKIKAFVKAFDSGKEVQPFSFKLSI